MEDAAAKADNAGVRYFFTWNVNLFVLWDRGLWREPLLERKVRDWPLGIYLRSPEDVARPENLDYIRDNFIPKLLLELGRIYRGEQEDWPMPADDIFLRSLQSHLQWPIENTRGYLSKQSSASKEFDRHLQKWMLDQDWAFVRTDNEQWGQALDRASQTLVHVLANRLIFYQALRARFPRLPNLHMRGVRTPAQAYAQIQRFFQRAVDASGDYEPLFAPREEDWAGRLVFEAPGAIEGWQSALRGIERYDFSSISSDVVGKVFQRLVSPEERHKWGQHFTSDDIVDLINAFTIRTADASLLDPACGSGSFLVRAYYRKKWLRPGKPHIELLSELFGCDIALYPAHLATLNLAAREINDEANYPRIARKDFFDVDRAVPFCTVPPEEQRVFLPELDAVVGNPPYVRQEKIEDKKKIAKVISSRWPGLKLSGRSDIHCYFWPAAAGLLRSDGHFGFLTSSSWLDVEYGFALQKWILENFEILAIMESTAEPWFEDARVKTCATILRRCDDAPRRAANLVKFVQFKRPLREIIGRAPDDGGPRFAAADGLRAEIDGTREDFEDTRFRIIVRPQRELWEEGVHAGAILRGEPIPSDAEEEEDGEPEEGSTEGRSGGVQQYENFAGYAGGKWGRYLRAPDFYFEVMRDFGSRFVPLGEIVNIRFGVKSGCDAFFMPRDVTTDALRRFEKDRDFKRHFGVERESVVRGEIRVIRAGDNREHLIESEYLQPEVHSLMAIDRPVVRSDDVDRVVLLVSKSLDDLKKTHVGRYLRYGEKATFASSKSKAVTVPKRSTCASRPVWYDLTGLVDPGFAFWPMAQQYRHVVANNPDHLICNHNLFDLSAEDLSRQQVEALVAVLNSTLVGLFKTFYGRFAGTEGNLKTEVVDVNLIEVPDSRKAGETVARRLSAAFKDVAQRPSGRMVEEQLMECHSPERAEAIARGPLVLPDELRQPDRRKLDDAVFELLGVSDPKRRAQLVDRLYETTALHFRNIRVVEIQKMEQRSKSKGRRLTVAELASDAWDAVYYKDSEPLSRWIGAWPEPRVVFTIPTSGEPRLVDNNSMFDRETVFFGKDRQSVRLVCSSRPQAELVDLLASLGFRGAIEVPEPEETCRSILDELNSRIETARREFETLASLRTNDDKQRAEIADLLSQWFLHGKPTAARPSPEEEAEVAEARTNQGV